MIAYPSPSNCRTSAINSFLVKLSNGGGGGVTQPFLCLGFTDYVSHEGERPMAIRWRCEGGEPRGSTCAGSP